METAQTGSMPRCGVALLCAMAMCAAQAQPGSVPAGDAKSPTTRTLEAGAKVFQGKAPLKGFDVYLVGFHPMKAHPERQMEAHHYCHQMNEDFAQCTLFDSNEQDARLNGIEYIISEKLYRRLPEAEQRYWHPHNGEILSGQLIAPGIPRIAEHELMRKKMNSYGKTWHVWNTGHEGHAADTLPLGDAQLAWSFNRDGEALPALIPKRDRKLDVDTAKIRQSRSDLQRLARPQRGVDDLNGQFGRPVRDIPGVSEEKRR